MTQRYSKMLFLPIFPLKHIAMKVGTKIWLEIDDQQVMGTGRYKLLKAIGEFGSISEAAKSMNMSYKKAWKLVKSMNAAFDEPLVNKVKGGKGGGLSTVTDKGLALMGEFLRVEGVMRDKAEEVKESLNEF